MKIDVVTLTGRRMRFEIDRSHALDDLEDAVHEAEGIPWFQQRLILGGKILESGLIVDQIEKIRDLNEEIRGSSLVEIRLVLRLIGGGNMIFHRPDRVGDPSLTRIRRISLIDSADDGGGGGDQSLDMVQPSPRFSSEDELSLQNGTSSSNLELVQCSSETSLSRERLKKFGFGSKTVYPLQGLSITDEKGSGSKKIKESNNDIKTAAIEGGGNQVLFEIPHSVTEHIEGKETNALYSEGISQVIQGMYSLQLFRSQMENEKQMALGEQTPQMEELIRLVSVTQFALDNRIKEILEFREERSQMHAEIANLKEVADDAENKGYGRGYERACRDIEECITNEHP